MNKNIFNFKNIVMDLCVLTHNTENKYKINGIK